MILRTLALIGGCIVLETTEQVLYRLAGRSDGRWHYWELISPAVIVHFTRLALWYLLLKTLPLGVAVPLLGANYIMIALAGWLIFGEKVNARRWLGTALVVAGFVLVAGRLE